MKKYKCGLTSVTFRSLSAEKIIELAAEQGLDGIEWGGDVHCPAGDIEIAKRLRENTLKNNLEVFSYGSYYRVQKDTCIANVLETAAALGTDTVRIWLDWKEKSTYTKADYNNTVEALKYACNAAEKKGIKLCLEFHNGTYNDSGENCIELINSVGCKNLKTYWQPLYTKDQNLADIKKISNYIENVHVYNWSYQNPIKRKLLSENYDDWQSYIKALGAGHKYILEFTKNDDVNNFISDVKTLKKLLSGATTID